MKHHWTLGDVDNPPNEGPPVAVKRDTKATPRLRQRLMRDMEARLSGEGRVRQRDKGLSRVEKAMRRNAPDLAGADARAIAAAQARRFAHLDAKWPRPRLLALIVLIALGVSAPDVMLRLGLWGVILFLVASVALGPERARDGAFLLWRRFLRLWKHELYVAQKVTHRVRAAHLETPDRSKTPDPGRARQVFATQMPR